MSTERNARYSSTATPEQVTLLVLRSFVDAKQAIDSRLIKLLPSTEAITSIKAEDEIRRLTKPVICRATVRLNILEVSCTPAADEPGLDTLNGYLSSAFYNDVIARPSVIQPATIQVLGSGENAFISVEDFGQWLTEYNFAYGSFQFTLPDSTAQARGAVLALRVLVNHDQVTSGSINIVH